MIDSIENNIEHAQVNVEEGVNLLGAVRLYFFQSLKTTVTVLPQFWHC